MAPCRYCGKSLDDRARQYLNVEPLCLHELPPHVLLHADGIRYGNKTADFLNGVLAEAFQVDLDDNSWSPEGIVPPTGRRIYITMPALGSTSSSTPDQDVPVQVEKRVKGQTKSAFLARRSYHDELDIEYSELDTILSQNHCGEEAQYDPSVFDANELFKWPTEDLQDVVRDLKPEWRVKQVQMSSE
jgi:hypothetical protein